MGTITALEVQKRNKNRVNVYVDDAFAFSLTLDDAARLHKGQVLDDAEVEAIRAKDAVSQAVDSASRFLSYRPRSTQEVRDNLTKKGISPTVLEAALERLAALGYLDDQAFAAFWVRERNRFKPVGSRALRFELRQKGVGNSIIDEVLADLDVDDAAYRAATSQMRRLRGSSRYEFSRKLGGFLQRRGFSYDVARTIIRRLQEEIETDDPEYFTGDRHDDKYDST
jgi:regulatory protein